MAEPRSPSAIRALGFVSGRSPSGMDKGWTSMHERVRKHAEAEREQAVSRSNAAIEGGPMCPICLATAMMVAGSVTSTGGIAAPLSRNSARRTPADNIPHQPHPRRITMASSYSRSYSIQKSFRTANGLPRARHSSPKRKEFTRLRDELSRQRRTLPWEKVEKQL